MLTKERAPVAPSVAGNASERARLESIERELQALGASAASAQDADRAQLESRINALKLDVTRLSKTLAQPDANTKAETEPAAAAQQVSRSLMSPVLENTQLGDVRCRATLCRIEASHGSLEAERKFIARIGELEAFRDAEGFVERVPHSDGSITTMVFVSRSGHRLPGFPDGATFPLM
jgi:hypothetical protein